MEPSEPSSPELTPRSFFERSQSTFLFRSRSPTGLPDYSPRQTMSLRSPKNSSSSPRNETFSSQSPRNSPRIFRRKITRSLSVKEMDSPERILFQKRPSDTSAVAAQDVFKVICGIIARKKTDVTIELGHYIKDFEKVKGRPLSEINAILSQRILYPICFNDKEEFSRVLDNLKKLEGKQLVESFKRKKRKECFKANDQNIASLTCLIKGIEELTKEAEIKFLREKVLGLMGHQEVKQDLEAIEKEINQFLQQQQIECDFSELIGGPAEGSFILKGIHDLLVYPQSSDKLKTGKKRSSILKQIHCEIRSILSNRFSVRDPSNSYIKRFINLYLRQKEKELNEKMDQLIGFSLGPKLYNYMNVIHYFLVELREELLEKCKGKRNFFSSVAKKKLDTNDMTLIKKHITDLDLALHMSGTVEVFDIPFTDLDITIRNKVYNLYLEKQQKIFKNWVDEINRNLVQIEWDGETIQLPSLCTLTDMNGTKIEFKNPRQVGQGGCRTVFQVQQVLPEEREAALVITHALDHQSTSPRGVLLENIQNLFWYHRLKDELNSPFLSKIYYAGAYKLFYSDPVPGLLMELLQPIPLKMDLKQAITFSINLVRDLSLLHQSGICHGDMKPDNLMLDKHEKKEIDPDTGIDKQKFMALSLEKFKTYMEQQLQRQVFVLNSPLLYDEEIVDFIENEALAATSITLERLKLEYIRRKFCEREIQVKCMDYDPDTLFDRKNFEFQFKNFMRREKELLDKASEVYIPPHYKQSTAKFITDVALKVDGDDLERCKMEYFRIRCSKDWFGVHCTIYQWLTGIEVTEHIKTGQQLSVESFKEMRANLKRIKEIPVELRRELGRSFSFRKF